MVSESSYGVGDVGIVGDLVEDIRDAVMGYQVHFRVLAPLVPNIWVRRHYNEISTTTAGDPL